MAISKDYVTHEDREATLLLMRHDNETSIRAAQYIKDRIDAYCFGECSGDEINIHDVDAIIDKYVADLMKTLGDDRCI